LEQLKAKEAYLANLCAEKQQLVSVLEKRVHDANCTHDELSAKISALS
jgi:hypothetical protein